MASLPVTDDMRRKVDAIREQGLTGRLTHLHLARLTTDLLADIATVESYLDASEVTITRVRTIRRRGPTLVYSADREVAS